MNCLLLILFNLSASYEYLEIIIVGLSLETVKIMKNYIVLDEFLLNKN